jgi:hypothetical protein
MTFLNLLKSGKTNVITNITDNEREAGHADIRKSENGIQKRAECFV